MARATPRLALCAAAMLVMALLATGCGNALYVMSIDDAEGKLEQAQSIEAERYATYEYYSAQARLDEAKRQAAQAEYGYAIELADEANEFAKQAIDKAQKARAKGPLPPLSPEQAAKQAPHE